jgi:hypothetical protein
MLVLVLSAMAAGGAARAGDSAQAEAFIQQGVELRRQGRDAPALPLFQKAYDLVATPRTAGQLGCGEMALGYWLDAEQHLGEALASPDDSWVSRNLKTLNDALTRVRANLGEIVLSGAPAGAKVTVNHRPVGLLPLAKPVRVAKGKTEIEVSAPGFLAMTQTLQVEGGARVQLVAQLVKAPPVAGTPGTSVTLAAADPAGAAAPQPPPPPLSRGQDRQNDDSGGGSVRRKIGWGLGITAGVVLVGSVVETYVWQHKRSQFNARGDCYEDVAQRGAPGCSSLFDSSRQAAVGAIIGYSAAALFAGGATVLLLTGDAPDPQQSRAFTSVACAPGLGVNLLSCHFLF